MGAELFSILACIRTCFQICKKILLNNDSYKLELGSCSNLTCHNWSPYNRIFKNFPNYTCVACQKNIHFQPKPFVSKVFVVVATDSAIKVFIRGGRRGV